MPSSAALCLCAILIAGLFYLDRKHWIQGSPALWIPLLWLIIIGSRPLTMWLGNGAAQTPDGELEGSALDRTIFLGLIVCGIAVLARRRLNWSKLLGENKWLCILYLYLGASVLWSDFPFVSFKRWVKDLGMVIMVLVVVTDRDPAAAVRTLLARCAYVLIPLSVVLIKYLPELGRSYNRWTGEAAFTGATTNKNELGMVLFAFALFLAWMWTHRQALSTPSASRTRWIPFLMLTPMLLWLVQKADSMTALVCALIGVTVLIALQIRAVRPKVSALGFYVLAGLLVLALLESVYDLKALAFGLLGRDVSLTGRTEIWQRVLAEPINPLFGEGFYSFWLGDRNERVSESFDYLLGTAHNGYIEVYLNSGLIGLGLLLLTMAHAFQQSKNMVARQRPLGDLCLALLLGVSTYAMTEAIFNRLGVVWFLALLASVANPASAKAGRLPIRHHPTTEQPGTATSRVGVRAIGT